MVKKNGVLYNRLKKKNTIENLFSSGENYYTKNYRFIFLTEECLSNHNSSLSVLFSVPKKRIKKAVDRNKIKRQTRNALQEVLLEGIKVKELSCAIIYTKSKINPYTYLLNDIKEFILFLNSK